MKCVFCLGPMKPGTVPFHIDRAGIHVSFDAVPAMICTQCGQSMFAEAATRTIEDVVTTVEEKAKKLARVA